MICAFLEYIRKTDPDFICGWNSSYFDFPYIIGRMRKLNIPMKNLSPFGNVYAGNNGKVIITGYVPLDQLTLYKLSLIHISIFNRGCSAQEPFQGSSYFVPKPSRRDIFCLLYTSRCV